MKQLIRPILLAVSISLLTGCSMAQSADQEHKKADIRTSKSQISSKLITNTEEWSNIYYSTKAKGMLPKPELPSIDFTQKNLLFVTMGEQPSTGYAIEYKDGSVVVEDETLKITVDLTTPPTGSVQATLMTEPVLFLEISKSGYKHIEIYDSDAHLLDSIKTLF